MIGHFPAAVNSYYEISKPDEGLQSQQHALNQAWLQKQEQSGFS